MNRGPQSNSNLKERIMEWLKKTWTPFQVWFKYYWQLFVAMLKKFRHRYQLTWWITVIFLGIFLIASIHLTFVAKTTDVENLKNRLQRPTMIYDRSNQPAESLYAQKGTYMELKDISSNVPSAVPSTEDRNFYHEHGFPVEGLGRAGVLLVKNKLLHRDYISGGGSTLAQQLVKSALLTQQQAFSRKARKIFVTVEVGNQYSKNEILIMCPNNAYFDHGVWGVQDAAKRYFNENASQLTVPQAATLAGVLASPGMCDPVGHPTATKQRRNIVLQLVAENHKLSRSAADQYKQTPLNITDGYVPSGSHKYPYFFDAVIAEAESRYHIPEEDIMNNGYQIYTTLDQDQQRSIQQIYDSDSNSPQSSADGTMVQSASITMSPKNGGITAVADGHGKHIFHGLNRSTQMRRQPESTIRPIAVYTPALEHGYFYDSTLQDKKQSYGTNNYTPKNYDDTYSGTIPMYKALYESLSTPTVWLLSKIGVDRDYDMAKKFGLPVEKGDKNFALALGGMARGVSPQQMARTYAVFANGGLIPSPRYITKIENVSGKMVTKNDGNKNKRITSGKTTREVAGILIGIFNHGTGETAKPSSYTLAGEAGTTSSEVKDDDSNDRDKWIVGYMPDVVIATWGGYDDTNQSHTLNDISKRNANYLYKNEVSAILPNTAGTKFTVEDAQTRAEEKTKGSSRGWESLLEDGGDFVNNLSQSVNSLDSKASQWWSNVRSLF